MGMGMGEVGSDHRVSLFFQGRAHFLLEEALRILHPRHLVSPVPNRGRCCRSDGDPASAGLRSQFIVDNAEPTLYTCYALFEHNMCTILMRDLPHFGANISYRECGNFPWRLFVFTKPSHNTTLFGWCYNPTFNSFIIGWRAISTPQSNFISFVR